MGLRITKSNRLLEMWERGKKLKTSVAGPETNEEKQWKKSSLCLSLTRMHSFYFNIWPKVRLIVEGNFESHCYERDLFVGEKKKIGKINEMLNTRKKPQEDFRE